MAEPRVRTVKGCRWAEPTLYLPMPYWLEAWDTPWTCHRDASPRLIAASDQCAMCPRWEGRPTTTTAWDFSAFATSGVRP
jgi:hypothetical protein